VHLDPREILEGWLRNLDLKLNLKEYQRYYIPSTIWFWVVHENQGQWDDSLVGRLEWFFLKLTWMLGIPWSQQCSPWRRSNLAGLLGPYWCTIHILWCFRPNLTHFRYGKMTMPVPVEMAILLHCGGPRLFYVVTPQHIERIIDRNDIIIYARRFAYMII